MKKFKLFALTALLALGTNAFAEITDGTTSWNEGTFTYKVLTHNVAAKTGTVSVTANGTQPAELVIKDQVTYKDGDDNYTLDVTEVADNGFAGTIGTAIKKVTFGKNISTIGQEAFSGATLLAEIVFPADSKLATLKSKAFAETQIVNPDFSNCTKLTGLPDYLFTLGEKKTNSYVKTVTLPTTGTFKTIETSLAGLVNLESTNIADTKINIIKANAFNGTSSVAKKLKAMEVPGTVETIEPGAFGGSLIEDLTINVDNILDDDKKAIGNSSATNKQLYWNSLLDTPALTTVLKNLTLKGELKGKVVTSAFEGNYNLAKVDMSQVTFASKGQIMTEAFKDCYKAGDPALGIAEVIIGDINHNGTSGEYTINDNAFSGCTLLTKVTIGNIDTKGAIGATAFGEDLLTLTIGDVTKAPAFKAGAFTFKTDATTPALTKTVTIGMVSNENPGGTDYVFPAGVLVMKTAKVSTITIGNGTKAIDSKGKVFAEGAITGTVTALTFNGDIIEKGLTDGTTMVKILESNATVAELNFNGKIGAAGIGDFSSLKEAAVVNFYGELAKGSIVDKSFTLTTPGTSTLTVNYTATPADATYNPFSQIAFAGTTVGTLPDGFANDDSKRTVTLKITGSDDLKNLIMLGDGTATNPGQISYTDTNKAKDAIYAVKFLADEDGLYVDVYQVGSTNVAYGRFTLDNTKIFKVERRPQDANITYTLYTTYVEEDEYEADATGKSGMTTLNMLPMLSLDGYYYIDLPSASLTRDLVVIVKATGSGVTEDLKMEYEVLDAMPTGATQAYLYTDERVVVAENILTNKMLRDDDNLTAATGVTITLANRAANDIYAITNPAGHEGISADILDYKNSSIPFVNKGMFIALGKHYNNVKAGRMIIKWLDESDATGIVAAKNVKAVENDVIYNLQGVRVSDDTKAGIYIKNGKKFIVK